MDDQVRVGLLIVLVVLLAFVLSLNYVYTHDLHRAPLTRLIQFVTVHLIGVAPPRRRRVVRVEPSTFRQVSRLAERHRNRMRHAVSRVERNAETAETPHDIRAKQGETQNFAVYESLARLILAGKLNLTDAVKIGCNAKSGERYQQQSKLVKEALNRVHREQQRPLVLHADGSTGPLTYPISRTAVQ